MPSGDGRPNHLFPALVAMGLWGGPTGRLALRRIRRALVWGIGLSFLPALLIYALMPPLGLTGLLMACLLAAVLGGVGFNCAASFPYRHSYSRRHFAPVAHQTGAGSRIDLMNMLTLA